MLTVGINQDYFVFVQTWEQRCLGKREEQRTGTAERGEEGKGGGLPECQSARFTSKRLGCERDITHSDPGGSPRGLWDSPGVSGDLGEKCGTFSKLK